MKPEPCEFTSLELIRLARGEILSARQLMSYDDRVVDDQLRSADSALQQAEAQLEHNNGEATPFPSAKDPWDWEDADTYGPSA